MGCDFESPNPAVLALPFRVGHPCLSRTAASLSRTGYRIWPFLFFLLAQNGTALEFAGRKKWTTASPVPLLYFIFPCAQPSLAGAASDAPLDDVRGIKRSSALFLLSFLVFPFFNISISFCAPCRSSCLGVRVV